MVDKKWKLNYEILGRRKLHVSGASSRGDGVPDMEMEMVDIQWTHTDGFPEDTIQVPVSYKTIDLVLDSVLTESVVQEIITDEQKDEIEEIVRQVFVPHSHPSASDLGMLEVSQGTREIMADQLNVPEGTPTSVIMQMLEEKRITLARALGIEP